jgi:hypothetical protein
MIAVSWLGELTKLGRTPGGGGNTVVFWREPCRGDNMIVLVHRKVCRSKITSPFIRR